MRFEIWPKDSLEPEFLEFEDRLECTKYVWDNIDTLQKFTTKTSGFIQGYAAEIDESRNSNYEEIALLYNHRVAGLIWVDSVF